MKRLFKWVRNLAILMFAVVLLAFAAGFAYEGISGYSDSGKYPPPGKMTSVGGHDMHIYAEGKGDVTVVFASGWGVECPYAEYYPIYSKLSGIARIAVYDRPGYGWSENAGTERDIDVIAGEIHELLQKSGEKQPYIFVGHSIGSLEVLRFAQLYKDEVRGIVMMDAGNPGYYSKESKEEAYSMLSGWNLKWILDKTGIFRLLFERTPNFRNAAYSSRNGFRNIPEGMRDTDAALYLKTMVNRNKYDEIANMKANAEKVESGGYLGDIPLRIITAVNGESDKGWYDSQESFKEWSGDSSRISVKGNHYFYQYDAGVVIHELTNLIKGAADR